MGQPRPLRLSLSRPCLQLFFLALLAPAALANPVPADELSLLNGADAFERYCTECHGWDPSEQYQALYGEDPIDEPDPLFESSPEAERTEPGFAAPDADDDWPEWAGPPPEENDEEAQFREDVLNDLAGAIDGVYGEELEPDGWAVLEDESLAGEDELPSVEEVFAAGTDSELARSTTGATDLTDPTSYIYGTTETDLFFNIAHGTGVGMPGFREELGSDAAVWDLVNYIRSLWPGDWTD
ncbi:MAG: hypothetical protein U5K56_15570 [Halioglobus sp.]|nr:hypothetical protein [Halioglobus sp.]